MLDSPLPHTAEHIESTLVADPGSDFVKVVVFQMSIDANGPNGPAAIPGPSGFADSTLARTGRAQGQALDWGLFVEVVVEVQTDLPLRRGMVVTWVVKDIACVEN